MKNVAFVSAAVGVVVTAGLARGQTFSLDDNPNAVAFGLVPFGAPGFGFSAEDPYGLGLPAAGLGRVGPSPSLVLAAFGAFDGELFVPGMTPDVGPPNGQSLDAVSADHEFVVFWGDPRIRFSVDRFTDGLPGTPLSIEFMFNQAPGDVFSSNFTFPPPFIFAGSLGPGPFAGVLPSAGVGGGHYLTHDESFFRLTAGFGVGNTIPPAVPAPPIMPGTHDNVDAYNDLPTPTLDVSGDLITDVDFFFSISPDEAARVGASAADIFDVAAGAPGTVAVPYAPAPSMGLDAFGGPGSDDIDGLVLWDNGAPLGPNWGGPGGEPVIDFALFSLSNGSVSLTAVQNMGIPVDGSTVFFTDFTGAFAVYAFGSDMGVLDMLVTGDPLISNVDSLEVADECLADVNHDGLVDSNDFTAWIAAYNTNAPECDQNCDGFCLPNDFNAWIANFNAGC